MNHVNQELIRINRSSLKDQNLIDQTSIPTNGKQFQREKTLRIIKTISVLCKQKNILKKIICLKSLNENMTEQSIEHLNLE